MTAVHGSSFVYYHCECDAYAWFNAAHVYNGRLDITRLFLSALDWGRVSLLALRQFFQQIVKASGKRE